MKLHRKLFTVQNQASILQTRKGEMKEFEERLFARSGELDGREKAVAAREASLQAREAACALKEEEVRETQKKLNQAVETLRGQWDRLREEKDRSTGGIGLGLPGVTDVPGRLTAYGKAGLTLQRWPGVHRQHRRGPFWKKERERIVSPTP